jgi:hypothetical protein
MTPINWFVGQVKNAPAYVGIEYVITISYCIWALIFSRPYRADGHRTRAALHLKDALIDHGRRLGTDMESRLIQQERQEDRAAATD